MVLFSHRMLLSALRGGVHPGAIQESRIVVLCRHRMPLSVLRGGLLQCVPCEIRRSNMLQMRSVSLAARSEVVADAVRSGVVARGEAVSLAARSRASSAVDSAAARCRAERARKAALEPSTGLGSFRVRATVGLRTCLAAAGLSTGSAAGRLVRDEGGAVLGVNHETRQLVQRVCTRQFPSNRG